MNETIRKIFTAVLLTTIALVSLVSAATACPQCGNSTAGIYCNSTECPAQEYSTSCTVCPTCPTLIYSYPTPLVIPNQQSTSSSASTSASVPAAGTPIGSYKNVTAYSNGGDPSGYYQCVKYVNRFYHIAKGMDTSHWYGNAETYYENAKSWGLNAYPNGGSVAPQPDDILVYGGGEYGHVAIITAVHENSVDIIEQNANPSNAYRTVSKSGNIFPQEGEFYVKGWVRK